MNNPNYAVQFGAPAWVHVLGPVLLLVVVWSLFWKGLSLWHSARRAEPAWFVILLILNTVGILDIIYLFLVAKIKVSELFKK